MLSSKCQKLFSTVSQHIMKAQVIVLNEKFQGQPTESNFKLVEEDLPQLKDGQFLVQAEYLSVDPYMRVMGSPPGKPLSGGQVAKIIESKNPKFPVGQHLVGEFEWRSHSVITDGPGPYLRLQPRLLSDFGDLPKSLALGVLGMPGFTGHFGFLEVCKPKEGDTVVVSGAAGAVGTHVGQIAKIKGCRVVGITGSEAKGKRLVNELNFDAYVNYKSDKFEQDLEEATPNRVDCYFDNVGGEVSSAVLNRMNKFGRVAICGSISTYNTAGVPNKASEVQTPVKIYHLRMQGFGWTQWRDQSEDAIRLNMQWIREGKLKYPETVTEGFQNMGKAFAGLFHGDNFGKAVVKV